MARQLTLAFCGNQPFSLFPKNRLHIVAKDIESRKRKRKGGAACMPVMVLNFPCDISLWVPHSAWFSRDAPVEDDGIIFLGVSELANSRSPYVKFALPIVRSHRTLEEVNA
jgi:hypothetical protein